MSLFTSKAVCESVLFYSHHIDPQAAGDSGVLSISNGHTTNASVPDQKYTLTVDASYNTLTLSTLSGAPAPEVPCFAVTPAGALDMKGNAIHNVAEPVAAQDVATKNYVDTHGGGGGGGTSVGLFGYTINAGTAVDIMNNSPTTVLSITVPSAYAQAKLFKIRMIGGWVYNTTASQPVVVRMFCTQNGFATAAAASDTVVSWLNVTNADSVAFGQPQIYAGLNNVVVQSNDCVFTVENAAGTAISNLYFVMYPDQPPAGTVGQITLGASGLSAYCEAYL